MGHDITNVQGNLSTKTTQGPSNSGLYERSITELAYVSVYSGQTGPQTETAGKTSACVHTHVCTCILPQCFRSRGTACRSPVSQPSYPVPLESRKKSLDKSFSWARKKQAFK